MKKTDFKNFTLLHIIIVIYSLGMVLSKTASNYPILSFKFILCFGGLFMSLAIYALGWQQIIKRLPLTTAFANKAVTIVWGIIWGAIFFNERITIGKIVGAVFVIIGVVVYAMAGEEHEN